MRSLTLSGEHPTTFAASTNNAFFAALKAYDEGNNAVAERHWDDLKAIWSHAWSANYQVLEFMQDVGVDQFA